MKITLTNREIMAILIKRFNLPANVTLEIVEDFYPDFIQKAIADVEAIGVNLAHNKIACIKAFRTHTNAGLADSKGIIEQWEDFKQYARMTGKLPVNPLYDLIKLQIDRLL